MPSGNRSNSSPAGGSSRGRWRGSLMYIGSKSRTTASPISSAVKPPGCSMSRSGTIGRYKPSRPDAVPCLFGNVGQRTQGDPAGQQRQRVDSAELVDGPGHQRLPAGECGHVGGVEDGPPAASISPTKRAPASLFTSLITTAAPSAAKSREM